jgi:hypothetical protein
MTTLATTLLITTLLTQSPAEWQPPVGPASGKARTVPAFRPSKDKARRLFARGQALHAKKKYRNAIATLNEALRHWNRREIHFNIALCCYELRDTVGAVRHLRAYLRGASRSERRGIPRRLRRLRRKVGVLVIESNDAHAEIWISGVPRGKGKVEWVVEPSIVPVTIRRPGAQDIQRRLRARAGGTTYWDATVNRIRIVGPGPSPSPSGKFKFSLHWRWFAVAASIAVATAGAAVGLGVKTRSLHDEFDTDPTWDTRDQGIRFQTLTNIMWGVAGTATLVAAGLAYLTRWKGRERPKARRITPIITPTGVGISGYF